MIETAQHAEWLNLIDRTGPFLSPLVLEGAFPQGLDKVETALRKRLRDAYNEWRDAVEEKDSELPELHRAWIQLVLEELLEFDDEILLAGDNLPETLSYTAPEHGTIVRPDMALDTNDRNRLLVTILEPDTDPDAVVRGEIWTASPVERMTLLCRATGVSLGLVTDGERWMLVFAPKDGPAECGTWYAHYWRREPITLQAFTSLLGVRRFFGPEAGWPETLLEKSLEYQDEVTETLGEQVRRAVEMLVQALDRADIERNRELLRDVRPAELYEAGLTVMMRLVFLLCAEERGLLLLGDEAYDRYYAISTLRAQLGEDASRVGLEVLERRHDAWSRLLATFRGIYGGISHEALRLPALGGSLFDPDRFPFLEGRAVGSSWKETAAFPLPIDNRTVLALLRALQVLEQRGGAQVLSYKALDVEQIGYVYEGLLEQTVARVPEATLGLVCSKQTKRSDVPLSALEQALAKGQAVLVDLLVDISGRSRPALTNLLTKGVDEDLAGKIMLSCGGDDKLAARIKPFGHLLRSDLWGAPLIYRKQAFAVTFGTDRRQSGSHYTPKVLTEKIVAETLEPVAYVGPAEGHPREDWRLKSPAELLDLKICDPAMGSGAFLVQVCRWLAQRLVEAWGQVAGEGKVLTVDGAILDRLGAVEPLADNAEERLLLARRLIAERCLYGVDLNPLAVELAKLSIWLVTLAKGRPFGFLDHNLRHGDSLLGIHRLEQLIDLDMQPGKDAQGRTMLLFAKRICDKVGEAINLRGELRSIPIRDIRDVEAMARLETEAHRALEMPEHVADGLVGEVLASGGNDQALQGGLVVLADQCDKYLGGDAAAGHRIAERVTTGLSGDLPGSRAARRPFHWALEFPEVFARDNAGFDAMVGNPPFIGGQRITGALGTSYRDYLVRWIADGTRGSADLVAYFFLQAHRLLRPGGCFGLLAVNTIAEGDTRQVGLERLLKIDATIYSAYPNEPWPGKAAVVTSRVHLTKGEWRGKRTLSGRSVPFVSAFLSDREEWSLQRLGGNRNLAYQGSNVVGVGFLLSESRALEMIESSDLCREVLFPYIGGEDINTHPEQKPSRWIINFWDWPEKTAKQYGEPYEVVLKLVKPQRENSKDKSASGQRRREKWWLYGADGKELYHVMGRGSLFNRHPAGWTAAKREPLDRVIAIARVSKTAAFAFLPGSYVYSAQLVVFPSDDAALLAILQSNVHLAFAWTMSSKMKSDLRYSTTDCVERFPFLVGNSLCSLRQVGESYSKARESIMREAEIGLTKLYNRFHTDTERDSRINGLRTLQRDMDVAVAHAYGWGDLDLGHGFHEVPYLPENDRVRFTISENARVEVLHRLAMLNKKRNEEETNKGLHPQKRIKKSSISNRKTMKESARQASTTKKKSAPEPQLDLFSTQGRLAESETQENVQGEYWLDGVADKILEWLEDHDGWYLKDAILQGCGINQEQWDKAVDKLLKSEGIQVRGTGDGRRYRVNM